MVHWPRRRPDAAAARIAPAVYLAAAAGLAGAGAPES